MATEPEIEPRLSDFMFLPGCKPVPQTLGVLQFCLYVRSKWNVQMKHQWKIRCNSGDMFHPRKTGPPLRVVDNVVGGSILMGSLWVQQAVRCGSSRCSSTVMHTRCSVFVWWCERERACVRACVNLEWENGQFCLGEALLAPLSDRH